MKRIVSMLLFMLIMNSSFSNAETVTTAMNNVPLQKSYSDMNVLALIPSNYVLNKTGEIGEFYNVSFGGVTGWISKQYTREGTVTTVPTVPNINYVPVVSGHSILKTDMKNALPAVNEEQLRYMIDNYCKGERRENLLKLTSYFIQMQNRYKVNAVFAVAVSIQESGGGTGGKLVEELNSYNMFSVKGKHNGNYVIFKGTEWKKFSSFGEAVMDFGRLIAEGDHYFKKGKYTLATIGPTYCNENWGYKVYGIMNGLYSQLGQ